MPTSLSPEPAVASWRWDTQLGLFAMASLLLLSLLLLLEGAYSGGRSVRGRRAAWVQGPRVIPPSSLGNSVSFWVRLSPEFVAVPPGNSVLLNCSTSCPQPESYTLRTQLQHRETLRGPGWVSYQLRDVRAWSSDVHCVVTCAGEWLQATARVTTYKRPHSVILEPPVLVGNEYMLRCQVTHVFPVGFLVVTLQRGGQVIYSESLKRFTNVNLANVTLSYRVPSQGRDLLQPVTCHARFNLNGMVVRSSSAPLMLTALAWSTESCLQPSAWSTESKALAFTSIAALVVILLAVGAAYLCKCL